MYPSGISSDCLASQLFCCIYLAAVVLDVSLYCSVLVSNRKFLGLIRYCAIVFCSPNRCQGLICCCVVKSWLSNRKCPWIDVSLCCMLTLVCPSGNVLGLCCYITGNVLGLMCYCYVLFLQQEMPLICQVKSEKRDGTTTNNPYVAFRRRTEKMQTRKVSFYLYSFCGGCILKMNLRV